MYLIKAKCQTVEERTSKVKKYKGYILIRIKDNDVYGNYYWEIWKDNERLTYTWTLSNAIEFINSGENENVLC